MSNFDRDQAVGELLAHLVLSQTDAIVAMHRPGESADEIVSVLEAEGWQLDRVEYVSGKRIRRMRAPL